VQRPMSTQLEVFDFSTKLQSGSYVTHPLVSLTASNSPHNAVPLRI
jgi:hypothetical protein